jgi:Family of unknown function (DUF5670)
MCGLAQTTDCIRVKFLFQRIQRKKIAKENQAMLWTILVILLVLWLVGLLGNFGGSLIHLLLVVAAVVLVINLLSGRRAV